jgi:hypothetical protein
MKDVKNIMVVVLGVLVAVFLFTMASRYLHENQVLKEVISRLEADSRIAEVLVTGVNYDEQTTKNKTTIKFLEYDVDGRPMEPKYFTFTGNVIQFQSLVIRFEDVRVRRGDRLRGKSAYLFWKVFMLDGERTQQYDITKNEEIPGGYRTGAKKEPFEAKLWRNFWRYALDPKKAKDVGIKNAQIEAPGTIFIPGILYTIKIEHDGGIRIDASPLPSILKGETIPVESSSQAQ